MHGDTNIKLLQAQYLKISVYVWYRWLSESVSGWVNIIPYLSITIDNKSK